MNSRVRSANRLRRLALATFLALACAGRAQAQPSILSGVVTDETGGIVPGVTVELRQGQNSAVSVTDAQGRYRFGQADRGRAEISFTLVNFATVRRSVTIEDRPAIADAVMHLALAADVTVTGKATFTNLAEAADPPQDLVGVARSASEGAITARQIDTRPIMRPAEVLETVPGLVISQHSGDGKANQYYLRGFNLDHGTDFATTVAGMPVNMPTHAHGHGYADLNFLIPELTSGVQFSKGPYFAEHGDFATAGAANVTIVNTLVRPMVRGSGGGQDFGRALLAASPAVGRGHVLGALEMQRSDGPWLRPDDLRKINGMLRYSRGDRLNGFAATAMGYRSRWNATDQIPARAITDGRIDRFGLVDASDGGESSRVSGSVEWNRSRGTTSSSVAAYGVKYALDLFSNFTYFLEDPIDGDQFQQTDRRVVAGARATHRRLSRWAGRAVSNTVGVHVRSDAIGTIGLYHTRERRRLDTVREDTVLQTSGALFAQNETAWTPWLRTLVGLRGDGYHFRVDSGIRDNSGSRVAGLVSPKGGVILGPFARNELYLNAGLGFHSNDARGATIAVDPASGAAADRVTPLVRARGAEIGVRTTRVPRMQMTLNAWTLDLESELVFVGDAGTTTASRPSHREGVEWTTYYAPRPWLTFDADVALSRARFTDGDASADRIPGAVETVVAAGATVDSLHKVFASLRWRYVGSRPLIEDNSRRSRATSLASLSAGYRFTPSLRLAVDIFNLFNARHSDIDYLYTSRLPGEPLAGIDDVHLHPATPRTARLSLIVGF